MEFYDMLADHYDNIFEVSTNEIEFLSSAIGKKDAKILDVACGTGQYSIALYDLGFHDIKGIDIDPSMIGKAVLKSDDIQFKIGSMLDIKKIYDKKFDFIFCIGNSIAHLNDLKEIKTFFKASYDLLGSGSSFVIQIINFDRIFQEKITSLPLIEKKGLVFDRSYELQDQSVIFNGILKVHDSIYENSIRLLAPCANTIEDMLKEVGFKKVDLYGDFSKKAYDSLISYALVVTAKK